MVDVSAKQVSLRTAEAFASIAVGKTIFNKILKSEIDKGNVLSTARIAGIQAAKKTSELIPLCHNIFITHISVDFYMNKKNFSVDISAKGKTTSVTGIEMEALTAVAVAALTIYDMCKALNKGIVISPIQLISKTGGKSGAYFKTDNNK
jgi:molybdenum cofactor biosynthesis protein MoaC